MEKQKDLFDLPPGSTNGDGAELSRDRYRSAMVFSAIGDALGWPTEFLRDKGRRKPTFDLPVHDFVQWQKLVGGKWWGYPDEIAPGEYSDDTQLTLAVARSISSSGDFEPETFAYSELPLWLHYERGGGKSIKAAARALIQKKSDWLHNYYKLGPLDYLQAGANGAAMRNLPIALVSPKDSKRLARDSFLNAVITHGHPRAILGAMLYGFAIQYVLTERHARPKHMIDSLRSSIDSAGKLVVDEQRIKTWIAGWETRAKASKGTFKSLFEECRQEVHSYLDAIPRYIGGKSEDYYRLIGALDPQTKGSGVGTVCAALFQYHQLEDAPHECIYSSANLLGSDTDTISAFVGALLGARHGMEAVPKHLLERIQDRDYLLSVADYLYAIATESALGDGSEERDSDRQSAYLRIIAWEIGLHEMFWDALDIDGSVFHPALGRGKITKKEVRKIAREGYLAKLIHIRFDCGQTCVFHSRVQDNGKVSESISEDVLKALNL